MALPSRTAIVPHFTVRETKAQSNKAIYLQVTQPVPGRTGIWTQAFSTPALGSSLRPMCEFSCFQPEGHFWVPRHLSGFTPLGFFFFLSFLSTLCSMHDLSFPTRDWTPALGARSLSHWTAREVLHPLVLSRRWLCHAGLHWWKGHFLPSGRFLTCWGDKGIDNLKSTGMTAAT